MFFEPSFSERVEYITLIFGKGRMHTEKFQQKLKQLQTDFHLFSFNKFKIYKSYKFKLPKFFFTFSKKCANFTKKLKLNFQAFSENWEKIKNNLKQANLRDTKNTFVFPKKLSHKLFHYKK